MESKKCGRCGEIKIMDEFCKRADRKNGFRCVCLNCKRLYSNEHYLKNKDMYRKSRRDWYQRLKINIFEHYGSTCVCCGEKRKEFLALDHINGGGNKHRKEIGVGERIYSWVRKNNYPPLFQILCHNCNMAKGIYGECPHETERKNTVKQAEQLTERGELCSSQKIY